MKVHYYYGPGVDGVDGFSGTSLVKVFRRYRCRVFRCDGTGIPSVHPVFIADLKSVERLFPAPLEGRDLNPLLQDPGLADTSADALIWAMSAFPWPLLCHCRVARRPSGCGLGALVKAVD